MQEGKVLRKFYLKCRRSYAYKFVKYALYFQGFIVAMIVCLFYFYLCNHETSLFLTYLTVLQFCTGMHLM
jgi:hypothetical protein